MGKNIYLIRHAETDFNNRGIVQGRGVDSSININGITQARKFYSKYKHIPFDTIYVSSLKRTYQTIEFFSEQHIKIEKHAELDEISWGIHEGKSNGDTFRQFYDMLHAWKNGDITMKIENGESPVDVQQRQLQFLKYCNSKEEENILICSHGRAIRILLCTMLNVPLKVMDDYPHQNVSLYKLKYAEGVFTIDLFNDITHLS